MINLKARKVGLISQRIFFKIPSKDNENDDSENEDKEIALDVRQSNRSKKNSVVPIRKSNNANIKNHRGSINQSIDNRSFNYFVIDQ